MKAQFVALQVTVIIALAGACTAATPPGAPESGAGAGVHQAVPATAAAGKAPFSVTIAIATYGKLVVDAPPGAVCRATATLPSGGVVLAADFLIDQLASDVGQAIWTYRTPVAGAGGGTGSYLVSCVLGGRTVEATQRFAAP